MKRLLAVVLLVACSKKPAEPAAGAEAPPSGAQAAEKPAEAAEKPVEPAEKPAEPAEKPAEPAEKPAEPAEKPAEAPPAEAPPAADSAGGLAPLPPLPAPPDEILPLVARKAALECAPGAADCPALRALAAKVEAEPDAAVELAKSGTDQEKAALRLALRYVRGASCDALLAGAVLDGSGALDPAIAARVAALRIDAAVKPLVERLAKAAAEEAIAIVDTLGAIGSRAAVDALVKALDDQTVAPYWGDVCRNLARNTEVAALKRVQEVGQSLAATDRQAEGCRNAEAAMRMLGSAGELIFNVGGLQQPTGRALVQQSKEHPEVLVISFPATAEATCAAPGEVRARFEVPLDRTGAPILGAGVAGRLVSDAPETAQALYLLQLDALDPKVGGAVSGKIYASHRRFAGNQHLIVSGPFQGTFCGG